MVQRAIWFGVDEDRKPVDHGIDAAVAGDQCEDMSSRAAPISEDSVPTRREVQLTFAGLMTALTLAALDQNIVSTALPRVVGDLGGMTHLSWVVTAFMLTSTSSTLLYGKLSDMYGRKPLFYVAISVFVAGSMLCGAAQTMTHLIFFRGLQGLGAGGLMVLAQTTIADIIPPRERGKYQGLFGAVFATCSVAGPLLGGFITDALSWRWIFFVNLPVGAAALGLISIGLKHRNRAVTHRIDYLGAGVMTGATTCLLLVLSWGGALYEWTSPLIVGLALAAGALYGFLWRHERRATEPILPLRLFSNPIYMAAVGALFLAGMALMGSMVFMPLYFQLVLGASPSKAGLMLAPLMGGVIVTSVAGGRLISMTGRYKIFPVCGFALATAAFFTLAGVAAFQVGQGITIAVLVVLGLGLGLIMPNLSVALQNAVDPADMGVATSVAAFLRSLGGAVGVAVSGTIVTMQLQAQLPESFFDRTTGGRSLLDHGVHFIARLPADQHDMVLGAYRHATSTTFIAGGIIAMLALLIVCFLPEKPLRTKLFSPEAGS